MDKRKIELFAEQYGCIIEIEINKDGSLVMISDPSDTYVTKYRGITVNDAINSAVNGYIDRKGRSDASKN